MFCLAMHSVGFVCQVPILELLRAEQWQMLKPPADRCAGPGTCAHAGLGWVKAVLTPCSYKLSPLTSRKKSPAKEKCCLQAVSPGPKWAPILPHHCITCQAVKLTLNNIASCVNVLSSPATHTGSCDIKPFHHPENLTGFTGDRNGSSETC